MDGIIIKNVDIITMDSQKRIIKNGAVIVKGAYIVKICEACKVDNILATKGYQDFTIVDGNKGILMPGMVNCHTHVSMIPFRGLADDCEDRLKKFIFPLEQKVVDKDLVTVGAKYGICEMLLGGVTTFCDMYYYENQVARVSKFLGMRGVLAETIVDFPSPDSKKPYGGLDYAQEFIEKWHEDELIIPAIAPHAPYCNDDHHLLKAYDLSNRYNVPMMMHVAEMDFEYSFYQEKYSLSPVKYLNKLGILDNKFIAAHLVLLEEGDIDILFEKDVGIAHNIGANAKGAKGVAPVPEMYQRGMKLGLGTDGPMSGNTLDIMTQMPLVAKIHKLFNKDRTIFPAYQIVEMATIGGARALNLDQEIGSIEVGKKADLVLIETASVNMQPIYDYYSTLVYAANPSNVDTVIVDGKILIAGRNFREINFYNIKEELLNLTDTIKDIVKIFL